MTCVSYRQHFLMYGIEPKCWMERGGPFKNKILER